MRTLTKDLKVFVLPGGRMPERRKGAEGFDAFHRAIVAKEHEHEKFPMRSKKWDFSGKAVGLLPNRVYYGTSPFYRAAESEMVVLGLGIIVDLGNHKDPEYNWSFTVESRSGTGLSGIRNLMTNVPVDSDFRGEPIAVLQAIGPSFFDIYPGGSLVQLIFRGPNGWRFPNLVRVKSFSELSVSARGFCCHYTKNHPDPVLAPA